MPSADFCIALGPPLGLAQSLFRQLMQISRGKFSRLPRTTAGSTLRMLDEFGLRGNRPARPMLTPPIRFLFIGSRFCSALPSDPPHGCSPCAPLTFTLIRLVEDFHFQAAEHARHTCRGAL
jgi:hypothetical protein